MVICFGIVLTLTSLRFVKILNFMISCERIRGNGPGVCSGMAGYSSSLVLTVNVATIGKLCMDVLKDLNLTQLGLVLSSCRHWGASGDRASGSRSLLEIQKLEKQARLTHLEAQLTVAWMRL